MEHYFSIMSWYLGFLLIISATFKSAFATVKMIVIRITTTKKTKKIKKYIFAKIEGISDK